MTKKRRVDTASPYGGKVAYPKAFLGDPNSAIVFKDLGIHKTRMVDGEYYFGHCRNASVARWSEAKGCFEYMRTKFGQRFAEDINHPEDDDGCDLFVPLFECVPGIPDLLPGDEDADEPRETGDGEEKG